VLAQSIKERMAGGMSLQEALEVRHAGKYDFTGRADGAKKLALDTLKQQLLTFSPAQPGEKPGAEAADAAVYRLSRKRAVIEVLRDGKGFGAFDAAPPTKGCPLNPHSSVLVRRPRLRGGRRDELDRDPAGDPGQPRLLQNSFGLG
jgi:hypothetical protein